MSEEPFTDEPPLHRDPGPTSGKAAEEAAAEPAEPLVPQRKSDPFEKVEIPPSRETAPSTPPPAAVQRAPETPRAPMEPESVARPAAPLPMHQIGVGTVLRERYELETLLGSGGMGSVYQALDRYRTSLRLPDRHVALKIAAPLPGGAGSRALGREFQSAQQLSHPNVINVYDIDHEGEASFYTMELLDGARLSEVLQPGGAWPQPHALAVIRDIGAAVAHAHSRGIVHGDLKPQNVFITHDGQVRVLDFGGTVAAAEPWIGNPTAMPELSTLQARMQAHRLEEPYALGPFLAATPAYASCEQLEGQPADPRDDLYALACIAYQLLAGRHPFDGRSSLQARALRLRPTRPRALRADAWRALRQALAFDRAQRSLEVDAWLRDLGVALAIERLPPHWPQRASMVKDRPLARRAVTAAVLLIGIGAIAWLLQQQSALDVTRLMSTARETVREAWQQIQTRSSSALGVNPPAAAVPNEPLGGSASQAAPPAPNPPPTASAPAASEPQNGSGAQASAAAPAASSASSIAGETGNTSSAPASAGTTSAPTMPMNGVPAAAAGVTFSATRYDVSGGAPAARIIVRRVGNTSDEVPFVWWTEAASAKPDVDYAPLGRRVELIPRGKHNVTIFVPIISNPLRQQPTQFYVALGELPDSGEVGAPSERATVTIAPTG